MRILVAMSGGVDSSTAAALLAAQGHEVVGVTMRVWDHSDPGRGRSCCAPDDLEDARAAARRLGIPFFVANVEARFRERVVDRFVEDYLSGLTPNPCVACNTEVKFDWLLRRARALGARLATGHYARVERRGARFALRAAADPAKDQSYFLYGLGQEELAHTMFPLGGMPKAEVRALARARDLVTADKRDSQEICFVPKGNYRDVLRDRAGWRPEAGPLLDMDGRQVGEHAGAAAYTVGQRQGLGVALGEPRYVWKIEPGENRVTLGRRADLDTRRFAVERVRFVAGAAPRPDGEPFESQVQIRHRGKPASAIARPIGPDRWLVETADPVWAAAPGQAAVFYDGDAVLGGGRIARPDE